MLRKEYENLSVEEKLSLVEELWVSIERDNLSKVSPEHKKILDERLEMLNDKNIKGKSWEEVKKGIKRKKK